MDAVIENNIIIEKISQENQSAGKILRGRNSSGVQDASLFPVYHGSAKNGLGIQPLMDAVTGLFQPIGEQGAPPMRQRFQG